MKVHEEKVLVNNISEASSVKNLKCSRVEKTKNPFYLTPAITVLQCIKHKAGHTHRKVLICNFDCMYLLNICNEKIQAN